MDELIEKDIEEIKRSLLEFEDKIKNNTFLITGGAGFLGSWLCDVVNAFGGRIICIDDLSSGSEENIKHLLRRENFELIRKDICEFSIDKDADYVIHAACIASPPLYQKYPIKTLDTNVLGTRNVLKFAKRMNVKGFLFTSTSEVYGDARVIPTPEDYWGNVNPIGSRSVYDEGKRVAETYCYSYFQKFGLPVRIARIFNTYGPRLDIKSTSRYGRVVVKFILQALNNEPVTVYGDGSQTRSFCYITDIIIGLFRLLLKPGLDGEVINIGNIEESSIIDLAKFIIKLTKSQSKIVFRPLPKDDPKRRKPDISKARNLLKWKPKTNLKEGLLRTISWFNKTS